MEAWFQSRLPLESKAYCLRAPASRCRRERGELVDDVHAVVHLAADDDEIVVHAHAEEGRHVDRRVAARQDGDVAAGGGIDQLIVVGDEIVLLDPLHEADVAVDAADDPVAREDRRLAVVGVVAAGIEDRFLEGCDVESLRGRGDVARGSVVAIAAAPWPRPSSSTSL